jgi:carbamoyl-phosphate synthase small subunit
MDIKGNTMRLWLEDGHSFEGQSIGAQINVISEMAEVVFNTSMTGYQEIISDPSYCDQIVVMTYPLIGQYGVNKDDFESMVPALKGLIVHEICETPSNWRSEYSLSDLLVEYGIPALQGIDTRELTKYLRTKGSMKAALAPDSVSKEEVMAYLKQPMRRDQISRVSTKHSIHFPGEGKRVVLMDFGYKKNILRNLLKRNCDVVVVPWDSDVQSIMKFKPSGILLSNGPGDPKDVPSVLPVIRKLQELTPMMAICMGHQLFALANGADTEKLKFGHRGANHPVMDLKSDRTFITSQNHSYAVRKDSIAATPLELTQINLNDDSVEGLAHKEFPAFSVQYHPEAYPGPEDTQWLFDAFMQSMK